MRWVKLNGDKLRLVGERETTQKSITDIARTTKSNHRQNTYEQSVIKSNKASELRELKNIFDEVKEDRPEDKKSDEYNEWYQDYQMAKEDYEAAKLDANEYWDDQLAALEDESSEQEADLQHEQTTEETRLEAITSEIEAVSEAISKAIEDATLEI